MKQNGTEEERLLLLAAFGFLLVLAMRPLLGTEVFPPWSLFQLEQDAGRPFWFHLLLGVCDFNSKS